MYIPDKNNSIVATPNFIQTLDGLKRQTAHELNCMRIGIIQNIYYEDLTVDVLITNKKTLNLNNDGTQNVRDFPLIRAKIVFCNPFISYPINQGDECVLLFSDREIESWFINGEVNPEGYPRMHALTDAVAILGIRSLPKMINILTTCLHLFYGNSDIQIAEDSITINAPTVNINGTLVINGKPYLQHVHSNGNQGANTGGVVE